MDIGCSQSIESFPRSESEQEERVLMSMDLNRILKTK